MSSFVAVLDACVIFPAALRDTLLRAADAGMYRLQWTDDILEEARRNLVKQGITSEKQAQSLIDEMRSYFPDALVTNHALFISIMTNDPKDRHVLAAAVAAGAQVIVTSNLRHFPKRALAPFSIEAQSPDEFLIHLSDLYPQRMLQILREQAQDLHKSRKTVADVLDKIALQAPRFAALMRAELNK